MADAAHPQPDDGEQDPAPIDTAVKNPFPTQMVVPGLDEQDVVVELAVVDGIVYAPNLDSYQLAPAVTQYITQYCAAWSSSVLTVGGLQGKWPPAPRRAQILFSDRQLHAMLGLADDERLLRVVVDQVVGFVRFVVESPRLPPQENGEPPPVVALPLAANYEPAS